ncbi:MAG: uracil-DNA glycosylase [Planctomycetes bacterium]|nr:uracil-DNA glycosylase [Planctomycetota bacterium]
MAEAPVAQKPFEEGIEKLIARLRRAELPEHVFNIYRQDDPELDARGGAAKRRENLRRYLRSLSAPKYAFIGIAPGYRGARFTGVPFSDEHRLCLTGSCYDRTSKRENAYREATAGVVLDLLGTRTDVVCWNIVPWHPHKPGEPLSNAEPDAETINYGLEALEFFFNRLYADTKVVTVGQLPARALEGFKVQGKSLDIVANFRHPAHGGANEFRRKTAELLGLELSTDLDE